MNLLFAWRYFKAKKTTNAINIIAWVSMTAITLITAAFVVLLSVVNGFEGLVKQLYASFYADVKVMPQTGKFMRITDAQWKSVDQLTGIKAWSGVVEEKALIQNGELQTLLQLKGVKDSYFNVTDVPKKIIRGKYSIGTEDQPQLVLGSALEHAVAVDVEKGIYPLSIYLFKRGVSVNLVDPMEAYASNQIQPAGTFYIQQDIDSKYGFTHIDFMKSMLGLGRNEFSAIEIALKDPNYEKEVLLKLKGIFKTGVVIETRYEQNRSLYAVMQMEKWVIYAILTLMLLVAAFTLIGALTMLVMEKQKDVQVLRALGADMQRIQRIFLAEGLLLGGMGAFAGGILGGLVCWLQQTFHLVPLEGGSFIISHYPVDVQATDMMMVAATVVLVTVAAAYFPSRKAASRQIELKA